MLLHIRQFGGGFVFSIKGSDNISENISMDGTPLWITIIGWCVTLAAAIIPAFIQGRKQKLLAKDFSKLNKTVAIKIDRGQFLRERDSLLNQLGEIQAAFDKDVRGKSTLIQLSKLLTRIESYVQRLEFSSEDQEVISSCCTKVNSVVENNFVGAESITSSALEKIKLILEKGDNLQ